MKTLELSKMENLQGGDDAVEDFMGVMCAVSIAALFTTIAAINLITGPLCLAAANYEFYHNGW